MSPMQRKIALSWLGLCLLLTVPWLQAGELKFWGMVMGLPLFSLRMSFTNKRFAGSDLDINGMNLVSPWYP